MKKRSIFILILTAGLTTFFSSCKDELADVNKNPNEAENPQLPYLLSSAIKNTSDSYWGVDNNLGSSLLFVQHWARIQYTEPDRYIFTNSSFTNGWNTWFTKGIGQLKIIANKAEKEQNDNYLAVSLTLQAWTFSLLTDAYGDIPYFQTGQIGQYTTPVYDSQEAVYRGILNDLKRAQGLLNVQKGAIQGDLIFKGSILQWKKFVNSLRLRFALRISDRLPDLAKSTLEDIAKEGTGYLSSNDDNARLVYQDAPNRNPISASFEAREDYRVSKTLIDRLKANNDPRLAVYADPTQTETPEKYIGVPNGLTSSAANSLGFAKTSRPGSYFRDPKAPAVILSYSEVLFGLSEAVSRGFITGDAEDFYKKAIKASLDQYKVSAAEADSYLEQASVQFDSQDYKKSIGNQKWIALYGQGLEAFAEWRRLDYPILPVAVEGVLNGKFPLRFLYPGTEQTVNGKNYQEAIKRQGENTLLTRLWFDIN